MATIYIGSARSDENGNTSGGAAGDQLQTSTASDTAGEVSMQKMYAHSKGWYVFRPIKAALAAKLANAMKTACNNKKIGYDQNNRLGIIKYGTSTTTATECDCSSLVRQCIIEAAGTDPGNFTTSNEATKLAATGLFEEKFAYTSQSKTPVYNGDVLVTKTKGHSAIVVSGNPRDDDSSTSATTRTVTATKSAASFSQSLAGTYKVTTSGGKLNIRNGAGTTYKVLTSIANGTKVKCYGYYTAKASVKWLYIQATVGSTTYTGFASSKYLTVI